MYPIKFRDLRKFFSNFERSHRWVECEFVSHRRGSHCNAMVLFYEPGTETRVVAKFVVVNNQDASPGVQRDMLKIAKRYREQSGSKALAKARRDLHLGLRDFFRSRS